MGEWDSPLGNAMKSMWTRWAMVAACVLAASGCATPPDGKTPGRDLGAHVWVPADQGLAGRGGAVAWEHFKLPGKTPVEFRYVRMDGRDALQAKSSSAASMMRHPVHIEPDQLGAVRFSWKVPELIADADLAVRDKADSPVRLVLAFDGDRSRFSPRDAALSELANMVTGEPMPYATLMYVWCNVRQPGSVIRSPRTDRIRKLVVESGPRNLNRWLDYQRDIRADFERAFGEPPGALIGIAVMTDSDNTHTETRAWYGQATLLARP